MPFLIVAAGTGGHILPGVRIGEELARQASGVLDVQFLCGPRAIEGEVYAGEGVAPRRMRSGANGAGAARGALFAAMDYAQALGMMLRRRPAGVLAMGGAACFPILAAARTLGVPIFLHESNRVPGRLIRMFHRSARVVFLGMDGLEGKNVERLGTPTRPVRGSAESERDMVVCVGGSQGAARLNELFLAAVSRPELATRPERFLLISGPGKRPVAPAHVEVREYEPRLAEVLARTRLVVSRSGAGSLADFANLAVPAILVPYPFAMDNHQLANARFAEAAGGAVVLEEKDLTAEALATHLTALLADGERLATTARAMASLARPEAASAIVASILQRLSLPPVLHTRSHPAAEPTR